MQEKKKKPQVFKIKKKKMFELRTTYLFFLNYLYVAVDQTNLDQRKKSFFFHAKKNIQYEKKNYGNKFKKKV